MSVSRLDIHKPYYGLILESQLFSSYTGHIHACGFTPQHPKFDKTTTSRIVKVDLYLGDHYAEFETRNSRYGMRGEDYENLLFFCTSDECKELRDMAEIDFALIVTDEKEDEIENEFDMAMDDLSNFDNFKINEKDILSD